ncbi:type IV secretory system conjugative DNA transfer family protein [Vibrio owensii]|uniref:type IV secretory system conjugative DNA transfer family protein n=1 Tax=Vibrio harveyi group TaxID=717610 RepID=UPI003CC543A5
MIKKTLLSIAVGVTMAVSPLVSHASQDTTLEELTSMKYEGRKDDLGSLSLDQTAIRNTAQKNAALAVGAQYGYQSHMNELKEAINNKAVQLDKIFDFNTLMKVAFNGEDELYLLPPVIQEVNDVVSVSNNSRQLRVSGKVWLVKTPERLVTAAPNWRQYLVFDNDIEISNPATVLLPRTVEEELNWKDWVLQGWKAGHKQADREMNRRVVNLGEDYIGMVKYMKLAVQGKVSAPMIVSSHQEVTGGGSQMRESDKVIQVSRPASLNSNAKDWKAIPLDTRESYRFPVERTEYTPPINQ